MPANTALDGSYAIRAAIRTALLANATINSALVGKKVVDLAPSGHSTPYISLETSSEDFSTATEDGQEFSIDVNVWHQPGSQTPESATARDLMAEVRKTLHTAALSLASPYNLVLLRVTNQIGPYRDPDGMTLHGVLTVRAIVDHS
jgi:hypothetical protein